LKKGVRQKVYIPFHFIPREKYSGNDKFNFNYTTAPNNIFCREIVDLAAQRVKEGKQEERERELIKLGIALHSFADTWAHQDFSGRLSSRDNDIERISMYENEKWDQLSFLEQLRYNLLLAIGHGEALGLPDLSHITWKYEHDKSGIVYIRDNSNIFLEAAQKIYEIFCSITGNRCNWKKYMSYVKECLDYPYGSLKKKFEKYRSTFSFMNIEMDYDKNQWKEEALDGSFYEWDELDEDEYSELEYNFRKKNRDGDKYSNMRWIYFHMEALEQRLFVQKFIP